jgi:hypothetical protein
MIELIETEKLLLLQIDCVSRIEKSTKIAKIVVYYW